MDMRYKKIIEKLGRKRVKIGEPLARHTTFGIGGPADLFYEARSVNEITLAVRLARELEIPLFILGGGSNLLIADQGFPGLVLKINNQKFKVQKEEGRFKVTVGAGMKIADLVGEAHRLGLSGLEFMVGIPGTVGGAIRGNAGAWQEEIGDRVEKVEVLNEAGRPAWVYKKDCGFSYRQSRFKKNQEIILRVKFSLKKGDRKKIAKKVRGYQEKRSQQPKKPSAGCVFVNPKPQPAGTLIDQCGLKGKKVGKAQISPQHANFIVNLGEAKATDVLALLETAKEAVKKKFGVILKEEIQLVGFDKLDKAS